MPRQPTGSNLGITRIPHLRRLLTASYLGARRLLFTLGSNEQTGASWELPSPHFSLPFPWSCRCLHKTLKTGRTKFTGRDASADQQHLVLVVMSLGVRVKGGCVKPSTPGISFLFPATTFHSIVPTGNTLSGQGEASRKLSH